MYPYMNEDAMFERLKDLQREAENSRLMTRSAPRLGRDPQPGSARVVACRACPAAAASAAPESGSSGARGIDSIRCGLTPVSKPTSASALRPARRRDPLRRRALPG